MHAAGSLRFGKTLRPNSPREPLRLLRRLVYVQAVFRRNALPMSILTQAALLLALTLLSAGAPPARRPLLLALTLLSAGAPPASARRDGS